ncbi:MAG: D-2-hydroxyacid dehydrogenase [Ruminiclostridium sp.]
MKIVITDSATVTKGDISFSSLAKYGTVIRYDLTPPEKLNERIRGAEMIICNKTVITAETMAACPTLKYIGLFATGYNNVDIEYAKAHGIAVCNAPAYSTDGVAQHTFALILEHYNRVCEYNKTVAEGDWVKSKTFSYFPLPIGELRDKTIGIVGFGSIGKQVAKIALAFNMKVLVNTRTPSDNKDVEFVSFEDLLQKSDIITFHCPLAPQTNKLMNKAAFEKVKQNALIINTARGPIIDETALREALDSGKIMGAGIDVLESEPMSADCKLLGAPNCIITPHVAWAGLETRERLMGIVEENIKMFLEGKTQNNVAV